MPSTYTPNNGITLQANGENNLTWGTLVNNEALSLIDTSLDGAVTLALAGVSSSLAITDGAASDGRNRILTCTGVLGGNHTITVTPNDAKKWLHVRNATTGGFAVIIAQGGGAGTTVSVEPGCWSTVMVDGTGTNANAVRINSAYQLERAVLLGSGATTVGATTSVPLHIIGNASNEIARFQSRTDTANAPSFFSLYATNPVFFWKFSTQDQFGGGTENNLTFLSSQAGVEAARVTITGIDGYVGIGVAAPLVPLHVIGHASGAIARFQSRIDSANQRAYFSLYSTNPAFLWNISTQDAAGGGTSNNLTFLSNESGVELARMTIVGVNGRVGIGQVNPSHPLEMGSGAHVTSGGTWTNASDVALKNKFENVDHGDILRRLCEMPVSMWQYKAEKGVTHIGPTAQDFRAAFGIGGSDKGISTVDGIGVAIAAIQALHFRMENTWGRRMLRRLKRAIGK